MREKGNHNHKRHVDSSEEWKNKSLTAAKNRKRFARFMNILLSILAALVVLACIYAYFFDGKLD